MFIKKVLFTHTEAERPVQNIGLPYVSTSLPCPMTTTRQITTSLSSHMPKHDRRPPPAARSRPAPEKYYQTRPHHVDSV